MNEKGRKIHQTLLYEIRNTLFSVNILFSYIKYL